VERLGASAPADHRNGRVDRDAGAGVFPEGIDRMETASLSNEAKSDPEGEARSRTCSSDTCDLEDLAIFQSNCGQFSSPHAATVDRQQVGLDVQS